MLLRPQNEKQLVKQLYSLPKQKRRVVVLIGRHPVEGSINIGVHNHRQWEKHGAVVVWIPPHWTPHGFWKRIQQRALTNRTIELARKTAKRVPTDEKLVEIIGRSIDAPVVNLHGTDDDTPSLKVYYHKQAPKWAVRALKQGTRRSSRNVSLLAPHRRISDPGHPLEILVEHFYAARKAGEQTRQRRKRKYKFLSTTFKIENPQLDPDYLTYAGTTRHGLAFFRKHFSKRLNLIIRELCRAQNRRKT